MYTAPQKQFRPTAESAIIADIEQVANQPIRRVFLADGDAMVLSTRRLTSILTAIKERLPQVERVSAYCLPSNVQKKSVEELSQLQALGLKMVYVGCESGDDEVLGLVQKGETFASSKAALLKLKQAGIRCSVMVLNGLGGRQFSHQHAVNSARLMNATQPDFLSTLVVSFPLGDERYQAGFAGKYEPLSQTELFQENRTLIAHLELENTVFRSDHASNYLVLKGTLGADKESLLTTLDAAIHRPGSIPLRPEWMRGL